LNRLIHFAHHHHNLIEKPLIRPVATGSGHPDPAAVAADGERDSDLVFLEVFNSAYFSDVSLSDWLTHTPPAMVAAHLNVDEATIASWPKNKPEVMPI
jgi:hypothetical protein